MAPNTSDAELLFEIFEMSSNFGKVRQIGYEIFGMLMRRGRQFYDVDDSFEFNFRHCSDNKVAWMGFRVSYR